VAAPRVRADYEQLRRIAQEFSAHADACRQELRRLQSAKDVLERGDWAGRGAKAFYAEMDSEVLPSLSRLFTALGQASQTTAAVSAIIQQAEDEAAARLAAAFAFTPGVQTGADLDLPEWLKDLLDGVFLGDFSEDSSLLKLLAQIGVGFVPYAGQAADARDILANLKNVIEGKELAWVGLGLAVLAIIPGLDALKAGKALRPIFRAMGDKGSREVVEFLLKNPDQAGRVARTLGTLLDHPQVIQALAENPDAALRLIREGSPEVVGTLARYGDEVLPFIRNQDALGVLMRHGPEGIEKLIRYGDEGVDLIARYQDDMLEFLVRTPDEAGDLARRTSEGLEAAVRLEEVGLHSNEAAGLAGKVAADFTHGSGDRVVLGRWLEPSDWADEGGGYVREAIEGGGVYYETSPGLYDALGRNADLAWAANEQFLITQLGSGRSIEYIGDIAETLITAPVDAFRRREIEFLLLNAPEYGYQLVGNVWRIP